MSKRSGLANWAAVLALAGVVMTSHPVVAVTLPAPQAGAVQVVSDEGDGVANEAPAPSTADESVRPSNAPARLVDPTDPSRRCGNIMLDLDDLCQYAGATQASAATRGRQ